MALLDKEGIVQYRLAQFNERPVGRRRLMWDCNDHMAQFLIMTDNRVYTTRGIVVFISVKYLTFNPGSPVPPKRWRRHAFDTHHEECFTLAHVEDAVRCYLARKFTADPMQPSGRGVSKEAMRAALKLTSQ